MPNRRPALAIASVVASLSGLCLPRTGLAQAAPKLHAAASPSSLPVVQKGDQPPSDRAIELRQDTLYTFEFSKAEVQDVVKAISDMTRQNFIIPERIKGQRITILCPKKVTAQEAYQVFFTALSANGISVVRTGKFFKLLDSKEAIKDTVPTCVDGDAHGACSMARDQMVTVLMRLRYVDAAQVNAVARALLSKDGDITVFQPSNALIISEYSPNLKRVRGIIEALDVAGFDDALQIVSIQHAAATEVADKLTQIFDISNSGRPGAASARRGTPVSVPQAGQEDGDVQISKIVPDDRTNQLIIKANRRSFNAIRHLISKIDVPVSEAEHGRVHVYYLENAKSEDLASTLSSLAQGSAEKKPRAGAGAPAPNIPPGGPRQPPQATSLFEGEVKITADKATNSLLVMASGHDYRSLRTLIEKLDVARRQVYVEAAILEVNVKDSEQFGLSYHFPKQPSGGFLGGSTDFLQSAHAVDPTTNASPTLSAFASQSGFISAAGGAVGGVFGKPLSLDLGNGVNISVPSFGALLKWLTTTSNANVLSTPHILTTDNEEAHIEVGEKVPFNSGLFGGGGASALASAAGSSQGAGFGALGGLGLAGLSSSVQRIDVSLKLTLTPQINERNKIRLEVDQAVEDIVGEESKSMQPTTSKRAIKTVVVAENQQTIVLGGLIKDSTTRSNIRIPYLGSIPIIGWLFKSTSKRVQKTNLMLVLTPYIISSADDFQRIFERKMREHEEFAAEYYGHRKEFRAHIDYQKKQGPLGRLVTTMRREREKYENGGSGDGSETLVGPAAEANGIDVPRPLGGSSHGEAATGVGGEAAPAEPEGHVPPTPGSDGQGDAMLGREREP